MTARAWLTTLCLSASLGACASSGPEGQPSTERADEDFSFDALSRHDKFAYMRNTVLPTLRPLFQAYDPVAYADFDCTTCHGDDAMEVGFRMPNPKLPALYPTGHPKLAEFLADPSTKPIRRFMYQKVLGTMLRLLDEPAFDPETGEGFGCYSCHPKAAQ